MNELYLIPSDGVTVRDPVTGLALPVTGASKPRTAYWLRRLRDGDVKEGEPPAPQAPAKTKPAAAPAAARFE